MAVIETTEERAKRLGLTSSTPENAVARAQRLGLNKSANLPDHDAPEIEPSYAQQALGGIASLVRDMPGAEGAQAVARALVRRQPYREALSDIRGAEDAAPSIVRNANRFVGGGLASAALPGGAAWKGAQYGALTGALSSDPNSGLESRAIQAGAGAAAGALAGRYVGKVGEKLAPAAGEARDAIVSRFGLRGAIRPAVRLGEASASKAEGFVGNSMDNVLEAVKAREASTPSGGVMDAVKRAPTRHRTKAQFDHFADQMAERQQVAGTIPDDNLEALLAESIKHVRTGGKLSLARSPK